MFDQAEKLPSGVPEARAQEIGRIAEQARRLRGAAQARFVDEACGEDAELRLEVEATLSRLEGGATAGPLAGDFEQLLAAAAAGDPGAVNEFLTVVYDDLREIARGLLVGERRGAGLPQATSLVNRAIVRFLRQGNLPAKNRRYFFGAAKLAMRRIICEVLRRPQADGDHELVTRIRDEFGLARSELLALDEALERMQRAYPDPAEVVRLRVLNGLSVKETSLALEISDRTVEKYFAFARGWLRRALGSASARPEAEGAS